MFLDAYVLPSCVLVFLDTPVFTFILYTQASSQLSAPSPATDDGDYLISQLATQPLVIQQAVTSSLPPRQLLKGKLAEQLPLRLYTHSSELFKQSGLTVVGPELKSNTVSPGLGFIL